MEKKKRGCESVFSAFSMKTPINPRGFLTHSFPTPYYSKQNNHHWTRWPTVLSSNCTHSVALWCINCWKCLQWSDNFLFFFFKKTQNKTSCKLMELQLRAAVCFGNISAYYKVINFTKANSETVTYPTLSSTFPWPLRAVLFTFSSSNQQRQTGHLSYE